MHTDTLTARTLPTINTMQLIGADGEVGTMSPTGHVSGNMALHLKAPDVRYLISDTHDLAFALHNNGYRLDDEARAAAAAVIDQSYVNAHAGLRLPVRQVDVIDVHDTTWRPVPDTKCTLAPAADPSRIAATVRVSPLGMDDLEIRLSIFPIPTYPDRNPGQPRVPIPWITHTLVGVRKILDIHGYELTYAAEYTLMLLFTSIP